VIKKKTANLIFPFLAVFESSKFTFPEIR